VFVPYAAPGDRLLVRITTLARKLRACRNRRGEGSIASSTRAAVRSFRHLWRLPISAS
jgi:hypothetical protein